MSRLGLGLLLVFALPIGSVQQGLALDKEAAPPAREPLPEKDPLLFLEKSLAHYQELGIKGYTALLHKQERIGGELKPSEEITIFYRENPHSVLMLWQKGERKATSALFVEGENEGMMLAHPSGFAGKLVTFVRRDPEGDDARQSGRYSIKELGLKEALQRTLKAWKAAREEGKLQVEYLGVKKVQEVGNRPCYVLRRTNTRPEEDGVVEGKFYYDKDTLLQVGTVLKGQGGKLVGEYFFRDIQLNPTFKADQFQSSALQ